MNLPPNRAFDRILIIMFENQYRQYVMANPYFKSLADQGIDMQNFFGVMHPSQTNYIASIAGELCNVTDDDRPAPLLTQQTIVDLVEGSDRGLSWKGYMDAYIAGRQPWTPELQPADSYPYVIKHNPFSSFENIVRNQARWKRIQNESDFWQDVLNGTLPNYAWFTPDMWNDGHYIVGTQKAPAERAPYLVDQAAGWLKQFFGSLGFPGPDSKLPAGTLVVVTFDEADFEGAYDPSSTKKYTYDGPNQIYTVLLGDMIEPGSQSEGYNHYSLIRTIEENFGMGNLGKNDAHANWFRFLWNEEFAWGKGAPTPIHGARQFACASLGEVLCIGYVDGDGKATLQLVKGDDWAEPLPIPGNDITQIEMAAMHSQLMMVWQTMDKRLYAVSYSFAQSRPGNLQLIDVNALGDFSLCAWNDGQNLMLAFEGEKNGIETLTYQNGAWAPESTQTGYRTDGSIDICNLGESLYLVHQKLGSTQMMAASYNLAEYNVVTVPDGQYAGPYDNSTIYEWTPSPYPVAHFSYGAYPGTPKENEPVSQPYEGQGPMALACLDGVMHLVHRKADSNQLQTETFSIHGILTPANKVSYNEKLEKLTSNGYGTLVQAGWTEQVDLNELSAGGLAMCRLQNELVMLSQPKPGGEIRMIRGKYGSI